MALVAVVHGHFGDDERLRLLREPRVGGADTVMANGTANTGTPTNSTSISSGDRERCDPPLVWREAAGEPIEAERGEHGDAERSQHHETQRSRE